MNAFEELGLSSQLIKGIDTLGFTEPTSVQKKAIPELLNSDSDFICLAQTGTGKTAAFGLPLLHKISFDDNNIQSVILSPTRELCLQITKDLDNFSKHMEQKPRIVALYGGENINIQLRALKRNPHIIVATAGRLVDVIKQKAIDIYNVRYLILDEADEMLNMGFKDSLDFVVQKTSKDKTIWLFSATMSKEIKSIAYEYMESPKEIIASKSVNNSNIEHIYYVTTPMHKYKALRAIIDYHAGMYGIIFCKTKLETQELVEHMVRDGYSADAIHGDLSQIQRNKVMNRYRDRLVNFLVATDVASRGIDINDITHVINYSLPDDPEVYVHRSGRTARAGKKGISLSIVSSRDIGKLRMFERMLSQEFIKTLIPTGKEICDKMLLEMINKLKDSTESSNVEISYMQEIYSALENISKEELINRLVSNQLSSLINHYGKMVDLNYKGSLAYTKEKQGFSTSNNSRTANRSRTGAPGSKKLFINLGKIDIMSKRDMLSFLTSAAKIPFDNINNLSIKDNYSFFEVKSSDLNRVVDAFNNSLTYNGRVVNLEIARDSSSRDTNSRDSYSRDNYSRDNYSGGNFRKPRNNSSRYR